MSVVILGGNECMERRYKELCALYKCKAKIYPKMKAGMKDLGSPDLLILFTDTISHKMVECALNGIKGRQTIVERSHSSSMAALKNILDRNVM